ncbi:hypothetical protein SLEP1_g24484 [Rubroshorea leprosula]|uniref:Uncharacterized protein n=1 Tax=Rubroshorea leprosula TaxID=152421 RepID=A0AAV5JIZ8_9ROSI|nr:hypothetical protein SLEP1_g24484 [Rubroshorea leprosula]
MDILASKYISISRSRNNCLEIHIKSRISCLAQSPGPEITAWRYTSDPGYLAWHLVALIIADLSIGVSTPRIHLGALQVHSECRYGLKKDFLFGAVTFWRRLWETELKASLLLLSWLKLGQPEVETRLSLLDELVLAQLLARNNPGDPLINLLNPAPQPPTLPQNPEPVQHAPAVSESQGQSHVAPAQQPPHDDVTRCLDSLEKLVAQNASDALMCKIFPLTLRGNARTWYYSLPPRSINSYTEMTFAFATKFSSRRLIRKTTFELMRVKQRDGESLKNFMSRFNDAVLEVNSFNQAVGITAVISGLSHERFRDSLLKHPANTFSEVNDRSLKFITAEEYALSQNLTPIKNQHLDWKDENPNRKRMKTTQNRGPMSTSTLRFGRPNSAPPQQLAGKPPVNWTPFNLPRSQIFMQIKNKMDLRRLGPMRTIAATRDHTSHDLSGNKGHSLKESVTRQTGKHVFVDIGSALDIMYFHCFESLGLDPALLQRYDGPIYGFNNQPVPVEGVLTMNFPTPTGIATLRGNQEVARHCYITSITQPQKGKAQTPEINPKRIPDDRQVMGVEIVDNRPEDETRAALVEDVEEVQIDDRDPSRKTQIGTKLNSEEKAELIAFLRANKDVFAWTSADMPGIPTSVSQHKLSTNPLKKPVAQKRRLFEGERLKVIKEEVEKLLQADFIRRVDYCEWVANLVLVKKANGKWRMCIDYTNLNDACPKDCYPMPNIDKLVEAASGNERLSLLDAYSGYHQVPMAPADEDKTSFYAGDDIYCYVMMPFGLKNAGATYQKMVTIVFRSQIGRNLEVYVDDIVVKSLKAEDHLANLEETFNNLRKNRMRLNPAKCIFGVESGKFLGFMVSRRGIEVNPEKIKAVAKMEPPKSIKDVQRLTGRVAALHRFISKSADKCLPFFKIIRLATQKDDSGKQKKFEWNPKCQDAFDELKSYLSSLPLLTKAEDGEILYLYLGISDEAISSVLIREEGKQQKPVYYISSVLHGAEVRYSIAEKAALAVVTSARKLRPLIKWAVELGEFELTFQQRSAIRAQALADFIVECTSAHSHSQSEVDSWILYVDDASSNKGSGAGALLLGPEGKIPRAENERADSLSKFASDGNQSSRSVFVEVLNESSFMKPRVMEISTDPSTPSWTDPILSFLRDGIVPEGRQEAMKLRRKASWYTLVNGVLYKRSFSLPLLRCLSPYEAEYALREVHEGVCESHVGARTLAHKVLRQGYYWPNMYKDATHFVQKCLKC